MKNMRLIVITGLALLGFSAKIAAGPPAPSYAKDVKPFLAKYCLECHNAEKLRGGLNMELFKTLEQGGEDGPVFVAGKPDESRIVLQVEGKAKPKMPPQKAKQPQPSERAVLRAWVAAGAKDDSATFRVTLPEIKPRVPVAAPITSLAYRPDGKLLAAGTYKEIILIDVASGDVAGKLPGLIGKVTALTYSRDGLRLATATGSAGAAGEVRIYDVSPAGLPAEKSPQIIQAHKDLIYDLAFSPDGKILASCGYDRLIKLWDAATGKELRALKDHSDTIYSVAFSPDGRLLASGAADRAVKVWDVGSGKRLYTLSESTDWVYAVAWSPEGKHVAAGGVDKSIRVWEVSAAGGKIVNSVFAHEQPVTRLIYSSDGKTLYSASEDRTVKSWNLTSSPLSLSGKGDGGIGERKVYEQQPEAILAMAVGLDQKQLAVGRYDGTVVLLEETTGKVLATPLPVKPKPPQLAKMTPASAQRGRTIRLALDGKYLEKVGELTSENPKITGKFIGPASSTSVQFELSIAPDTPAGVYQLKLKSPAGESNQLPFTVDLFASQTEQEPNDSPTTGQRIKVPATIVGSLGKAGDLDFYRFEAQASQEIGVQVLTKALGSKVDPVLALTDAKGEVLTESSNGLLAYRCPETGTYSLGLRDREYRGGKEMHYRLHIGDIPIITGVFPLGVQRGTEADIHLEGVNLGKTNVVRVKAPAEAAIGSWLPVNVGNMKENPLGNPRVMVGEFPEVSSSPGLQARDPKHGDSRGQAIPVPGTANGRINKPESTETWRFKAKKGQRLVLEVNARRIGSPLDSYIEILDAKGQLIPRATLRCLAKTYTTFRDHDAAGPGIRIETWGELAINDYLLVGNELTRIWALPKNPDDDCQFYSVGGQRVAFLDTTPTYHSLGTPMYKVSIHPPSTTFPPNGFPVVTLYYRNDDGGSGYGKDSRLFFDPPVDGEYQVRIGDSRGQGGVDYAYRLTVRPPRPNFNVSFTPTSPSVPKGSALPITVTAERIDGYEGPIEVRLENLPPGFSAPATSIPAGENSTSFALGAEPTATPVADARGPAHPGSPTPVVNAPGSPNASRSQTPVANASGSEKPLKLIARAMITGQEVVREVSGGAAKVVEPGELLTTAEQSEVAVQPGKEVPLTVKIERRNGFKGRVPLDVRGLPHGVRVLDIGLNGILITENETSRTFVIYAEPWVQPTTHPFVILARNEGKGTEFAAKSVLLKVANNEATKGGNGSGR
jgi:WD40 repeat protein